MDDLISRQDVIYAVLVSNFSACTVYGRSEEGMATAKELIQTIKNLPSAHPLDPCETCLHNGKGWDEDPCDGCTGTESKYIPNNGWIPVSERLPVYGEKCLVDFKLISGVSHYISTSYCYVQKEGFWSDTPFQYKAIAWMPLPDPYKEEE